MSEIKLNDEDVTSQYLDCRGYTVNWKERTGPVGGVLLIIKEEIETKECGPKARGGLTTAFAPRAAGPRGDGSQEPTSSEA